MQKQPDKIDLTSMIVIVQFNAVLDNYKLLFVDYVLREGNRAVDD